MMRKLRLLSIYLVLLLIFTAACSQPESQEYPPNYETYASLIGQPKDTVLKKLGLTEADLAYTPDFATEHTIYYAAPKQSIQYKGISFTELLYFSGKLEGQPLYAFCYAAGMAHDSAMQNLSVLAKDITEKHGPAREKELLADEPAKCFVFAEQTEDTLLKRIKRDRVEANWWNLSDTASQNIKDYLKARVSGHEDYTEEAAVFLLALEAQYSENTTTIAMSYIARLGEPYVDPFKNSQSASPGTQEGQTHYQGFSVIIPEIGLLTD